MTKTSVFMKVLKPAFYDSYRDGRLLYHGEEAYVKIWNALLHGITLDKDIAEFRSFQPVDTEIIADGKYLVWAEGDATFAAFIEDGSHGIHDVKAIHAVDQESKMVVREGYVLKNGIEIGSRINELTLLP